MSSRPTTSKLMLLVLASGCVLAPRAAEEQRAALARAGSAYRAPFEARDLPALPSAPTRTEIVRRALAANGDVEVAYFDWAAAVHRIDRAGAYPNTAFSLDVSRALSGGGSAFDRTSATLGFDPMENLSFPTKVYQAAVVATDDARAAERRLVAARFEVQRRALASWIDYGLRAERLRLADAALALATLDARGAAARVAGGAASAELTRAESARRLADDTRATLVAEQDAARVRLTALLALPAATPLAAPAALEPVRAIPGDDAWLLRVAAEQDPTLAALALDVTGRADAVELARQQYIPDFNPFVGTEGAASQVAGLAISIPTLLREVGAMIRESRANLAAATARQRQAGFDRTASLVAALVMVRNADRRIALARGPLGRLAADAVASAGRAYANGDGAAADLVAARRAELDVRMLAAEAWAARETAVAELESLVGIDVETLAAADAARAAGMRVAGGAR